MVQRYDFTEIINNQDRQKIIDEFCETICRGDYTPAETMEIRKTLVKNYLEQSCSVDEEK